MESKLLLIVELTSTVIFYIIVERNGVAALQNKYPVIISTFVIKMYWEHITNQLEQRSLITTDIFLVIGGKKNHNQTKGRKLWRKSTVHFSLFLLQKVVGF